MSNCIIAQGMKDLHYTWYLEIISNCSWLKASAILRELSNVTCSLKHLCSYDCLYYLSFLQNQLSFFHIEFNAFYCSIKGLIQRVILNRQSCLTLNKTVRAICVHNSKKKELKTYKNIKTKFSATFCSLLQRNVLSKSRTANRNVS